MATTIPEPPKIDPDRLPDHSGNGGWRNLGPADVNLRVTQDYSPPPSSTAICGVLFPITMMFAAFTSAFIVRKASQDWQTFTLPSILSFNTLLLIASSVSLEVARHRIAAFMGGLKTQVASPARWLYITLFLGLLFVAGQYVAWTQLRAEGHYHAPNTSSSFFYLLIA